MAPPGSIRRMGTPRGAGRSGGLLFLAILGFVAYLTYGALDGAGRWVLTVVLVTLIAGLGVNVLRRR